jgi:hypothetical protein
MDYIVGYRGYQIIRKDGDRAYQIYKDSKLVSDVKYYDFGTARHEIDYLKTRR